MTSQHHNLVLEVAQHHTLYGCRGCGNSPSPQQAGRDAEDKTTHAAEPVASAPRTTASLQLRAEDEAMSFLVRTELTKLIHQCGCGQPGQQNLSGVDRNGTMLPGMIDLDDAVAQIRGDSVCNVVQVSPDLVMWGPGC